MIFASDLPAATRRVAGALLLLLLAVRVCWSRLALGAHYITDLLGGALLAIVVLCRRAGRAAGRRLRGVAGSGLRRGRIGWR